MLDVLGPLPSDQRAPSTDSPQRPVLALTLTHPASVCPRNVRCRRVPRHLALLNGGSRSHSRSRSPEGEQRFGHPPRKRALGTGGLPLRLLYSSNDHG